MLFVDHTQVDQSVRAHLGNEAIVRPYEDFLPYLKQLAASPSLKKEEVTLPVPPIIVPLA